MAGRVSRDALNSGFNKILAPLSFDRCMTGAVHLDPQKWLDHMFSAKAVERGGVIRRSVDWVDHEIGRDRLMREVAARGFSLLQVGGQFVIICSRNPIRRLI